MKNEEKIVKYLKENKNPYVLKIDDMFLEFEYSNSKKTFNECMIDILKQNNQ